MAKKKNKKTTKSTNKTNYRVIILLIILIIGITIYVNKKEKIDPELLDSTLHNITSIELEEINEETDFIKTLRNITNGGDINTFITYQSMYTNESVTINSLNTENILYITYKYIEKTKDLTQTNKLLTCEIAEKIDLSKNIIQCGGSKYSLSTFQYNTYITKEILQEYASLIFNVNITEFKSFYTNEDNICHYINNEYICVTKKIEHKDDIYKKEFVKAKIYDNKIEIIENYYYIKNGTKYKYFKSTEEGSSLFISTFEKTNSTYHWVETKPFKN